MPYIDGETGLRDYRAPMDPPGAGGGRGTAWLVILAFALGFVLGTQMNPSIVHAPAVTEAVR